MTATAHETDVKLPKVGARIRLLKMVEDPDPIPPLTSGTVYAIYPAFLDSGPMIAVDWDNGRKLNLLAEVDEWEEFSPDTPGRRDVMRTLRDGRVIDLYQQGLDLRQVGRLEGISHERVRQILVANSIPRRPRGYRPPPIFRHLVG